MFYTQNYTVIWCDKCNTKSVIEPGKSFDKLECKCDKEVEHGTSIKPRATNQAQRKSKEHKEQMA